MSEEKPGSFKVNDKRRFDAEGAERGAETGEALSQPEPISAEAPSGPQAVSGSTVASTGASDGGSQAEINFSSFIMSLATQALMQLGQMPVPKGMDLPVDRVAAKQTIDLLELLHKKTQGNLEPGEEHLMQDVLHNLRMLYVRKSV